MSLYRLWQFQNAFCVALALVAAAAAVLGFADLWPAGWALVLASVALSSLALLFPRGDAPERPSAA